jgi:hypothetical protein
MIDYVDSFSFANSLINFNRFSTSSSRASPLPFQRIRLCLSNKYTYPVYTFGSSKAAANSYIKFYYYTLKKGRKSYQDTAKFNKSMI